MENSIGENILILVLLLFFLFLSVKMLVKITSPFFFKGKSRGRIISVELILDKTTKYSTEVPVFEFLSKDGKKLEEIPRFLSPLGHFTVGDEHELRYNVNDPKKFVIHKTLLRNNMFPTVVTIIITIFLLFAIVFFLTTIFL